MPHEHHNHGYQHDLKYACCHGNHDASPITQKALVAAAVYVCPMHPDVRQDRPGNCSICGMTLEPEVTSGQTAKNDGALKDMKRRFWGGLALATPVAALEMGAHFLDLQGDADNWIQLVLATPVVLWAGWPFFQRGWASL
ncbi:MAG: heavy metal-binding domain-containing protein, partial [Alphaproteobacteria bacterium]|nr:heavy metal-binding domain-containing protein [Alphaproteobacteria bacterium]